jgi:formimidoylglutamate deiminase
MSLKIFAKQALTSTGWQRDICVSVDESGCISDISKSNSPPDHRVGILLPGLSNLHSHSFQRAMAGLAEQRGASALEDFWSWRKIMYRFLDILSPDDIEAIAALVQMEMLESGYAAMAEFHYLHHDPKGVGYSNPAELSERLFQASLTSGIGYSHLPVLYMRGGLDDQPLQAGQRRFGCDLDQFQTLYTQLGERMRGLPQDTVLGVAPHSLRAVTLDGLLLSSRLNPQTPVHIHIAEQQNEVDDVIRSLGARPIRWLLDNIEVDNRWCLVHATQADQRELVDFAKSGAVAGLCPITEANLGDGIFNAPPFIEQGGRFGIGSDSNVKIALSEELRMLEMSQRLRDHRRVILSSQTTTASGRFIYEHAAVGGAQALGRNAGSIHVGALADLVALDDQHYALAGLTDDRILDTWIFASADNIVSDVWAAGRHRVSEGRHSQREAISRQFLKTIKRLRSAL